MRAFKHLLSDKSAFERLLRAEIDLAKDSTAAARAAHLEITARKKND
jgi:hypothetical protein